MLSDAEILSACPDFISVGGLFKASPLQEGDARLLYFEASNEDVDHQNEVVLQKALQDSSDYYLRHGNIDISHYTIMGPKAGIPDFMTYEIGKPTEVRVDGKSTFVKAELYQGDSPMAKNANMVWESLTAQIPPSRWYASVGGAVLSKSVKLDPKSGDRVAVVDRVRWNNTALDRCPVNKSVPEISIAPIGVFAKSLGGFVMKGLEAGYATDSAAMTGGSALRVQSLDHKVQSYFDFRNKIADDIRMGRCKQRVRDMAAHAVTTYGLSEDGAAEWVERFMRDLKTGLERRKQ